MQERSKLIPLVLPLSFLLAAIQAGPALDSFFILDDFAWLDCATDTLSYPGHIFTLHISNFFRPTVHLLWAATYALFGPSPLALHLLALLAHALAVTLLALLVRRLAGTTAALLAALLFCLHPMPTEALLWISAITEPLVAIAMLSTLLAFHSFLTRRAPRRWRSFGLVVAGFVLTHCTKESAVSLLPLMMLLHLWLRQRRLTQPTPLWAYAPLLALEAIYLHTQYLVQQSNYLVVQSQWSVEPRALVLVATSAASVLLPMSPVVLALAVDALMRRAPRPRGARLLGPLLAAAAVLVMLAPYAMFRAEALPGRYFYGPCMACSVLLAPALARMVRPGGRVLQAAGAALLLLLAVQYALLTQGQLRTHVEVARQTARFLVAARRLPTYTPPIRILDSVLKGQHLRAAMRLYHPRGTTVAFVETTRAELRRRPTGSVWRYGGKGFERVDLR